jgi:hypothetical protein
MSDDKAITPIFDLESQRKYVNALFGGIPAGHGHARVKFVSATGEVSFAMAARVGDHWMLQGEASYSIPDRRKGMKIESIWSW